jgi:spore coat protein U-like protein
VGTAHAAISFTCSVTAVGINFGVYSPASSSGDAATGSWTVTCTATGSGSATVAGTLALSTGSSGSFASRTMKSGVNALNYNIYLTPSYTQVLGDGTQGTYAPSASGTVTAGQVYQIGGYLYGLVPAAQDVAPGSYADTIVITVTY